MEAFKKADKKEKREKTPVKSKMKKLSWL